MVLAGSSPPLSRLLLRALGNQRHFLRALSLRLLSAIAAAYHANSTAIVGRSFLSRLLSCASSSADIAASSLRTLAARPYWRSPLYPLALSIARSSRQPTPLFSCIRSFRRCRASCAFKWSNTATAADTAAFSSPLISRALLFAAYRTSTSLRRLLRERFSSPLSRERFFPRTLAALRSWRSAASRRLPPLLHAPSVARSSRQLLPLFSGIRSFQRCRSSRAYARLGDCRSSSAIRLLSAVRLFSRIRSFRRLSLLSPSIRSFRPLSPLKSCLLLARSFRRRSLLHSLRTPSYLRAPSYLRTPPHPSRTLDALFVGEHRRILCTLSLCHLVGGYRRLLSVQLLSALFSPHPSRALSRRLTPTLSA